MSLVTRVGKSKLIKPRPGGRLKQAGTKTQGREGEVREKIKIRGETDKRKLNK